MNKIDWIFFDLDGTLADSLDAMYEIYFEFLSDYGFKGNKQEFQELNGPTIREVVSLLKNKYNLNKPIDTLLNNYQKKIELIYPTKVKAKENSSNLLKFLQDNNYKLALVTSANKKTVDNFLTKYGWINFFSIIIYGDEVKNSKPSPEIYNLCLKRSKANKNSVLVVEDSENGFNSANSAGLICIIIDNKKRKLSDIISYLNKNE